LYLNQKNIPLFGENIFNQENSNLSLPTEVSVDGNYILSSGDQIQVNLYSDMLSEESQKSFNILVNQTGTIFLGGLGTINVRGKKIKQVKEKIMILGQKKYKDIKIDISLLKMRSIKIFVLGEVKSPGSYILNPLSNILNSLYLAKGITSNSSLRNIKIVRMNETITIDLYKYLLEGKKEKSYILQEGDTVFVPVNNKKVTITGAVVRPATYEIKEETVIKDIIKLAGGIKKIARQKNVKIKRITDDSMKILDISDIKNTKIKNGDIIQIGELEKKYDNGVYIVGNVMRTGLYEIKGGEKFQNVLEKAGGLKAETYLENANILRQTEKTVLEKIDFNLEKDNPELLPGDTIYIYNLKDIGKIKYARIEGMVEKPGMYKLYKNTKISDLIFQAKGIKKKNVYLKRADIYRIKSDGKIKVIKINLEEVLNGNKKENIRLEEYDLLKIYSYDDVETKDYGQIVGAVREPGNYPLQENNRKVSDLIFQAKGLEEKGVYLKRADIYRVSDDGGITIINVNLGEVLKGNKKEDIKLKKYDTLKIYRYNEITEKKEVNIYGEVRQPGNYKYYDNMTINDLVFHAKGLKRSSDKAKIEIIRNTINGEGQKQIDVDLNKEPNFILKEYDQVFVRNLPNWEIEKIVCIKGEVNYPGMYSIFKNETLNQIIKRAGGFKKKAFPKGIIFTRLEKTGENLTKEEKVKILKEGFLMPEEMQIRVNNIIYNEQKNKYNQKIILEDGDCIEIPKILSSVKVKGEVYLPGIIVYDKKMKLRDYINAAGGLNENANNEKIYVIKYNGKVQTKKMFKSIKIETGDTIVIPKNEIETKKLKTKLFDMLDTFIKVITAYKLAETTF